MANTISETAQKIRFLLFEKPWLIYAIFFVGIFVRIYELGEKSLWFDEAWVANMASSDNLSTAFFNKRHTPPLFLSTLFASVHIFSNNEWFLRIVPALFSVGGMVLIYLLARKWLGKIEAVGALLLFSFMPVIFVYSRELKQYTCDIFFTLLLFYIMERILDNARSGRLWTVLAVTGGIGLWFSYPVAYVLSSVGIVLFFHLFYDESSRPVRYKLLLYWSLTLSVILVSIGFLYYLVVNPQISELREFSASPDPFWNSAFPDTAGIGSFIRWFAQSVWSFFTFFWNGYAPVVFVISMAGTWYLFRSGKTRILLYWGIIFLTLLISSFMNIFPFSGFRLTLFTAPFFIILFIAGHKALWEYSKNNVFIKPLAFLGILLLTLQVSDAAVYYKNGKGYFWHMQFPLTQEIKIALQLLEQKRKKNETVYIYYGSAHAFEYYSKYRYGKTFSPVLLGTSQVDNPPQYISELQTLIRNREAFWFLGTQIRVMEVNYINFILTRQLNYLSKIYNMENGALLEYYYPRDR